MCVGMITGLVGSCCASLTCSACGKMGSGISHVTRLCYGLFLMFSTFVSFIMLTDWASTALNEALKKLWFSEFFKEDMPEVPPQMIGALSVYRVMTGTFIFHAILAVCLIGVKNSTDTRAKIQNSGMGVKFLLYLALIVAMFFLPASGFAYLAQWPFKVGGALFIIVQLVFLVSFSFDIYEYLVGLAEQQEADGQTERRCIWANWVTLILTLGFYGFSFASFGMMVWLNDRKDDGHHGCPSAVFAGSANLLCMIIVSMLSVSNHVRDAPNGPGQLNGVFQASMISAYACYNVVSAFVNHPDASCHLYGKIGEGSGMVKTLGLVCTFIAVMWSAIRSGSNNFIEKRAARASAAIGDDVEDASTPLNPESGEENDGDRVDGTKHTKDEVEAVQYSYSQFHVMFALAACYIANLLTRWGDFDIECTLDEGTPCSKAVENGMQDSELSVGLKIGASFMCFAFYGWVMLAPPCFPDRDFSDSS